MKMHKKEIKNAHMSRVGEEWRLGVVDCIY